MGLLNFTENFFFFSVGLTILFLAIAALFAVLLVYKFKQRIYSLETKYETLFDIVTNVVKQLRNMQCVINEPIMDPISFHKSPQWIQQQMHLGNIPDNSDFTQQLDNTAIIHQISQHNMGISTIIEAESEHESEDESEAGSDSESEAGSEVGSEARSDSESEAESEAESDSESEAESEVESEDESEAESEAESESVTNSIKIITIPDITNICDTPKDIELEIMDDLCELPVQDIQNDYIDLPIGEHEPIVITKLAEINNVVEDTPKPLIVNDLYKKMTLANLKATVISKGLCSDPSKMKKNDLLKLLTENL